MRRLRAVGDVDVAVLVGGDRVQDVELSLPRPALAPRFHPAPVLVDLHDARVVVAVGDEDVAVRVPRDVGRAIERSPARPRHRPRRRLHRRLHRFGAAAEHHQHASGRVELHDHVRAFVRRPEVAALVDADRVREGEPVEILADLANERAVGPELEQLRRRLAVQRAAACRCARRRRDACARRSRRRRLRRGTCSAGSLRKSTSRRSGSRERAAGRRRRSAWRRGRSAGPGRRRIAERSREIGWAWELSCGLPHQPVKPEWAERSALPPTDRDSGRRAPLLGS